MESGAALVRAMTQAIQHRGPDDSGLEVLEQGHLVLGHRRLSILDLSPSGHQPMVSSDGDVWIVFNGEIYNFRELRAELEGFGCIFRSESDTEVILEAYRHWGLEESVRRFHGMFAFAIWDGVHRKLHLCRDRFGVKPLYYCKNKTHLAFASELRAIDLTGVSSRSIDSQAAAQFLQYGYLSSSSSIYADVQSVAPGTIVTFEANLAGRVTKYWSADDLFQSSATRELRCELSALPDDRLLDRLETSLTKAFEYRMVADVPVGLFLSGGIDSSLVATMLARRAGMTLRTFTIGYGASDFDEMPYARDVAKRLGTLHTELVLSDSDALSVVERLPDIADEPIGDSSLIPTFLVSRLAREHVTVALSGDGADELFGGYARYGVCGRYLRCRSLAPMRALYSLSSQMIDRLPPALLARAYSWTQGRRGGYAAIDDKLRKLSRMARSGGGFDAYESAVSEWERRDVAQLLKSRVSPAMDARRAYEAVRELEPEDQFMHFDTARYLPGDLLTKVDRASMSVSLEAREPFLDHELAELAVALPLRWKIRNGQGKYALRRILARHLPAEIFDRPKKGFSVPIAKWLRGPLRELLLDELSPRRVKDVGLLDPDAVQHSLKDFLGSGRRASPAGVWFLLQLQRWASDRAAEKRPAVGSTVDG